MIIMTPLKIQMFSLSVMGCIFLGLGYTLGETSLIGFYKNFSAEVTALHQIFSGMSAIVECFGYFALKTYGFSLFSIFSIPGIFYTTIYFNFSILVASQQGEEKSESSIHTQDFETDQADINKNVSNENFFHVFEKSKYYCTHFFVSELIAEIVQINLSSKIVQIFSVHSYFFINGYVIQCICFQMSMLIGKISFSYYKPYNL